MLKKHSQFFESLLLLFDLSMIVASWFLAYGWRVYGWPIPLYHDIPPMQDYVFLALFIVPIWACIFKGLRLYRPRRVSSYWREAGEILKASSLATLILMVTAYFLKETDFSRVVFVYFWAWSSVSLMLTRLIFRELLRLARRHGYNLRHILILGTEHLGLAFRHELGRHPELGLHIVGFLSRYRHEVGQSLDGVPILGHIDQVQNLVRSTQVDQIFIALPLEAQGAVEKIVRELGNEMVDIKVIPDLYQYAILRGSVEEFEGLPIITLSGSPMYGWNTIFKRALDLCVGVPALLLSLPLLACIALAVKLTSRGPVFYIQERMGVDGRLFRMLKFRTMPPHAEQETGAVWTQENDPRRTPLGSLLRRTSLDELPQLWNVLKGDMSLVGPRPERPVFIEEFRQSIPRYMLRHRVKAGMTGWAQVHGWRGNTSLEQRIEHDLYYIQHWTIGLDLKILWMTLWHGFLHTNAY
ncbi:MAG: undecaprenyl-phosphate glucose phosphotransferase [Candidatus Tectimicrobiota bacterium]